MNQKRHWIKVKIANFVKYNFEHMGPFKGYDNHGKLHLIINMSFEIELSFILIIV
jgi:hypothetical protein